MKGFLKIVNDLHIQRDGYCYPSAYEDVNKKLTEYAELDGFLDFIRSQMYVEIQWKNRHMINTWNDYKKLINNGK